MRGPLVEIEQLVSGRGNKFLQQKLESVRQLQASGDKQKIAWAVFELALEMRSQGQFANTVQLLEKTRVLFESVGDEIGLASTFEELSYSSRELSRNALALEYATRAIELLQKHKMHPELARAYDNIAYISFFLSKRHEALSYAKKARALFQEHEQKKDLAWNSCNLGMIYLDMDHFEQAEKYYADAVSQFKETSNTHGLSWALLGLATVYRSTSRFEMAMLTLEQAKKIPKEDQPKDYPGWITLNEAALHRGLGDGEKALSRNKTAVNLFGSLKNQVGVSWGLFQIGQIFRDRGMLVKSWQALGRTVDLFQDVSNQKGYGWAQSEWGLTHYELNNLAHAQTCFSKALSVGEQLSISGLQAESYKNLTNLCTEQGQTEKAFDMAGKANQIQSKLGAWEGYPDLLLAKARIYILQDEFSQAQTCLGLAEEFVERYQLYRYKPVLGQYKGEIQFGLGSPKEAIETWTTALKDASLYQQLKPRVDILMGLIQVQMKTKSNTDLMSLLLQVEKDVRTNGSRKFRIKYLVLKALMAYNRKGTFETRYFSQALRLLDVTGLVLIKLHVLEILVQIYESIDRTREKEKCRKEIVLLSKKSDMDAHFFNSKPRPVQGLPLSTVI